MSQALVLAATTPEHHTELPMPPNMYGVIAIVGVHRAAGPGLDLPRQLQQAPLSPGG